MTDSGQPEPPIVFQYHFTLADRRLFVSRYLVALPKPEQLQQLIEGDRAAWEQHRAQTVA